MEEPDHSVSEIDLASFRLKASSGWKQPSPDGFSSGAYSQVSMDEKATTVKLR